MLRSSLNAENDDPAYELFRLYLKHEPLFRLFAKIKRVFAEVKRGLQNEVNEQKAPETVSPTDANIRDIILKYGLEFEELHPQLAATRRRDAGAVFANMRDPSMYTHYSEKYPFITQEKWRAFAAAGPLATLSVVPHEKQAFITYYYEQSQEIRRFYAEKDKAFRQIYWHNIFATRDG